MSIRPKYSVSIDLDAPIKPIDVTAKQRSTFDLEITVMRGATPQDLTGVTPAITFGPSDGSYAISVTGSVTDALNGVCVITPTTTDTDYSGAMQMDLILSDDSDVTLPKFGNLILHGRAADDTAGTVPSGSVRDYSATASYLAVDGSGPYTEGVGIAFGTANAEGQIPITLTGGAGGNIEDSTTSETNTAKVIKPDGVGGVSWEDESGGTPEGTAVLSTGEATGLVLSSEGDNSSSWKLLSANDLTYNPASDPITSSTVLQDAVAEHGIKINDNLDLIGDNAIDLSNHIADTGAAAVHGSTDANTASAIVARDANGVTILSGLQLDTGAAPADSVGQIRWNDQDKCVEYNTENGTTIQVGQELGVYARNSIDPAVTIPNGAACYVSGATGNRPTVALANADAELTADTTIGLCTGSAGIANNTDGFITTFGLVRGLNTLGATEGGDIYLSDLVAGTWTQTEPESHASYVVRLGVVTRAHATLGEVLVNVTSRGTVIAENFRHATTKAAARATIDAASPAGVETLTNKTIDGDLNTITNIGFPELDTDLGDFVEIGNGMALDSPAITVTSNGTVISLSIEKSGTGDIRFQFSDGIYTLDTTPAATATLTAGGSDAAPQINFVYLLQSNKTLTVDTTSWPAEEHAPIATVLCQTAASLQTDGAYKVHQWTDHATSSDDQGHIAHLNSWIRQQAATWVSGVATTPTAGAAQLDVATSSGVVLQLHDHAFPAFNTATGSEIYLVNEPGVAYTKVANLTIAAGVDKDANGVTLGNNATDHYNLVLWGVVNEASGDCKLMCNLPTAAYANNLGSQAVDDVNNTAVYVIPSDFTGVGFLIARLTIQENGGTYTVLQNEDLRGLGPSTAAGGGATGGNEFADNVFRVQDDVDSTKELAFQVSGVTTATTRTLTVPDKDGTIATLADITGGGDPQELILAASTFVGPLATGSLDDCGYVSSDIAASAESGIGVTTSNATQQSKDYLITVTPPSGWTSWATTDCLEFRCWAGSNAAANCEVSFVVEDGTNTYLSSLLNTFTTADTPQTYAFDTADLTTGTLPAGPFQIRVTLWTANDFETIFSQVIVRGA